MDAISTTLLRLQPGSENGSYSPRTFGGLEGTLDWIVDGATRVDPQWGHEPHAGPGLDAIQEFTVESNAVSTKHSRPVNVVVSTKSGTNQFHGSAFETHRNNAIGLARSRTDFYTKPPQLIRNEFGANSGGPVIIPKFTTARTDLLVLQLRRLPPGLRYHLGLPGAHHGNAPGRFQQLEGFPGPAPNAV